MYLLHVKQPMGALIEEMDVRLARFAPEIVGDPRVRCSGSTATSRFSRQVALQDPARLLVLSSRRGKGRGPGIEAHGGAGFYFHLAPEGSSIGAGMWMPPRPTVALREAIVEDQRGFERGSAGARGAKAVWSARLTDAMLKRLPRGFDEGHPAARWLRYQSFTVGRRLSTAEVLGKNLPKTLEKDYRMTLPLVRWLNRAMGFLPVKRRL